MMNDLSAGVGMETQEAQREVRKQKFLDAMGRLNIISASCQHAGIASRDTIYRWQAEGYLTRDDMNNAYATYCDMLRSELYKRTMVGIEKPLYQNGKPVLDSMGEQIITRVIDSRLLLELCRKHLPEMKESDQVHVVMEVGDSIPDEFRITFDARDMNSEQWAIVKQVALEIRDHKNNTIDAGV
jgi:hypothetical protein